MSDWRRYPYTADWGDSRHFTFPACDGYRQERSVSSYFLSGFLQGVRSDRRYAFLAIFADMRVLWRTVRASFFTFSLFDCDSGHYGTCTDYDFPRPPLIRTRHKMQLTAGRLGLTYSGTRASGRWESLMASAEAFRPFAWEVELRGTDHHGAPMHLELVLEANRPPAPAGGRDLGGEMTFLGDHMYSYLQSGMVMRGRLDWGDGGEEVEGDVGWVHRQWSDRFRQRQDWRSRRYRSELRMMQLDNGWDLSCFHQYLRPRDNALVPWTGVSAQGPAPDYRLQATHRVELTAPELVRSPGAVRSRNMLSEGPRYFPRRFDLRVPDWQCRLESEPLVPLPAHDLPIEVWAGPVVVRGEMFGQTVLGLGFDQRSHPLVRDFELAQALQQAFDGCAEIEPELRRRLSYRSQEIEALCLARDRRAAAACCREHIEPWLGKLPASCQERLTQLATDLRSLLA